jgi:pimeloyl-ACP methyl ester carboxylesterase
LTRLPAFTATVRVTGGAGRFEEFRERVRWLLVRDPDTEPYSEHHTTAALEYRFELSKGLPFPTFVAASAEFPELRVEAGPRRGQARRERRRGLRRRPAGRQVDRRKEARVNLRQRFVRCASPRGLHRISYLEWGDPNNERVLVCVHGMTRCARDFDALAAALSDEYRVVCPDVAGRGDSEWLADPRLYQLPQYVADMVTLVARLGVETVHWVGTSMGALIGMALAGLPNTPVGKLVLNDAGPVVTRASLERIATYVGVAPVFPDIAAAETYVRAINAPFGPHSDAEWRFLTEVVVRRNADGSLRMHYDPNLGEPSARRCRRRTRVRPVWDAVLPDAGAARSSPTC